MKKHEMKSKTNWFFQHKYLIILLVVIAGIYLLQLALSHHLIWDEYVYLSNARSHLGDAHFTEDFRFPLLEYFISGVWAITGESVLLAQLLMIVFSLFSVFGVYLLSQEFTTNKLWHYIATGFFGLSNVMLFWSFRVYTDIPAMCAMIFSVYFFMKGIQAQKKRSNKLLFVAGVFAALSFLFRFPIILFILPLGVIFLIKKKYPQWIAFGLGGLMPLLPWLGYNLITYGNPVWDLFAQGGAVSSYTTWQPASLLLLEIIRTFGLTLVLLIPFVIKWYKEKKDYNLWLLISLFTAQLAFYLFIVRLKLQRYELMFLPFLLLIIILGAEYLTMHSAIKHKKKIVISIILAVIFLQIIGGGIASIQQAKEKAYCEKNGALQQSIQYATEYIPSADVISSNDWPAYGFYGNHYVTSTWTANITQLIAESGSNWIAYVANSGLEINQEKLNKHPRLEKEISFVDKCNKEITFYKVI